jgi:hypothetical protein
MQFSALAAARTRRLRPYIGLQALAAFSLAIGLGLELRRHLQFEYHASSDVVGWLRVNEYPKQQELLYFLLALIGLPLAMTLYWLAWIAYGAIAASRTGQPVERFLRQSALASLPLLLIWRDSYRLDGSWATMLGLPIGLTLAAVIGSHWVIRRRALAAPTPSAAEAPVQPVRALPRQASRLRRLLRCGLEYLALPIVVYVIAHSGNIHGRIDLFHEGERLGPLNVLLRGGIPFRDVYVQHGLFQDAYLARLGSAVFGPTLEGVRSMQRLLEPLGYVALYLLGAQVFRGGPATALLLAVIASGVNIGVSGRNTLALVSLALTASHVTRLQRSREEAGASGWSRGTGAGLGRLIWAGVTTSLAFWYSTEVGLYTLAAIGVFLVLYGFAAPRGSSWERSSPLVSYGSGVLIGLGSVGAYFLVHGALDDALANTYVQCAYQLDVWGRAFPSLSSILTPLADQGIVAGWRPFVLSEGFRWYLPVFVLVVSGGYLTYRRFCGDLWQSQGCVKLLLLWLAGAVFFRTALGRSDNIHMDFGATTAWMLLLFFIDHGAGRLVDELRSVDVRSKSGRLRVLAASWIIAPALALLWYVREVHLPGPERGGERKSRSSSLLDGRFFEPAVEPTTLERAGRIDIPADQEEQIREVVAYIRQQTTADEPIFDFANQGALYFFADRPNATRFSQAVYAATSALQQEVIDALERQQTRLVIFKTGSYADRFDGVPNEKRLPLIARYLAEHYEPAATVHGTELLKRRR